MLGVQSRQVHGSCLPLRNITTRVGMSSILPSRPASGLLVDFGMAGPAPAHAWNLSSFQLLRQGIFPKYSFHPPLHILSHQSHRVQRNNSRVSAVRTSVTFRSPFPAVERSLNITPNMIRQAQRTPAGRSQARAIIYPPRALISCPKPKR